MAKKTTKTVARKTTVKSAVRNSPIPKPTVAAKRIEITNELIARKAFEIFASGNGGSETDNWFQAERELRGTI